MYVELLDGRFAGQMRDIDSGAALDLVKLGRAKRSFSEPTDAQPPRALIPAQAQDITVHVEEPVAHIEAPSAHIDAARTGKAKKR